MAKRLHEEKTVDSTASNIKRCLEIQEEPNQYFYLKKFRDRNFSSLLLAQIADHRDFSNKTFQYTR